MVSYSEQAGQESQIKHSSIKLPGFYGLTN